MKSAATIPGRVKKEMNKKNEDMEMHNKTEIPLTTLRNGRNQDILASAKKEETQFKNLPQKKKKKIRK